MKRWKYSRAAPERVRITLMSSPNRRDFLQTATLASLAAPTARILGANDRINLAIIGLGGRGTAHMNGYVKQDCHIAELRV